MLRRRWLPHAAALLLSLAPLLGAGASAAPLQVVPASPLPIDIAGIQGTVEVVEVTSGPPAGGILLAGSAAADGLSLAFRVSLDPGSAPLGAPFAGGPHWLAGVSREGIYRPASGAGWVPGAEPDAQVDVVAASVSWPGVHFSWARDLEGGQATDLFFASFAPGVLEPGDAVEVALYDAGGQLADGEVGVLVPEPEGAILLGVAGVALVAHRLRR